MKRRNVLKSLIAAPAALLFPWTFKARTAYKAKKIMLLDSAVAGFQHYNGDDIWGRMKTGDHLHLVREPKNPFDYDAVEVYRGRDKLGYLPRAQNAAIAQMMDRGMMIKSKIQRLSKNNVAREKVGISVEMIV
jgi:hypothetical protein